MMASDDSGKTGTEISDFADILMKQDGRDPPVVVGGHAVNLWSDYFLAGGVNELAGFVPFTSKDLDLIGPVGLLDHLHELHRGKLTRSEPRSPVVGRIDLTREDGRILRIEVLHVVKGLSAKELTRTMELRIEGVAAQVLLPHLILKAKIENSATIAQEGRNDVKHVKMMIFCMRAFVIELVGFVGLARISERALINILEETFGILNSPVAAKAGKLWNFDFSTVWPLEELKSSGSEKILRWLEHRLA